MSKLLFVCGFPGGGTDLCKTILNAHPLIYLNGEMPLLRNLDQYGYSDKTTFESLDEISDFQAALKRINSWDNIHNIDHDFQEAVQTKKLLTLEEVLRISFAQKERQIWGNKTPQNTENIDILSTLFTNAYFLIVVRDIRDVCLSWNKKWGRDMLLCSSKWATRMRRGWHNTRSLPSNRYLFVKFEDLLSMTEICYRDICAFLEIPFSSRMLEHNKYTTEKLDGKINYGRAVISDNKDKWKRELSPEMTKRIEEIAYETMKTYNYEIAYAEQPRALSVIEKTKGTFVDAWAMTFTGNRSSQQNTIGKRMEGVAWELKKRL